MEDRTEVAADDAPSYARKLGIEDLFAHLVHQLVEALARVGIHEVVVGQRADLAADICGQLVELLLVAGGHVGRKLLECWVCRLLGRVARQADSASSIPPPFGGFSIPKSGRGG